MGYKVCSKCEKKKLLTLFHFHSNERRRADCMKCVAAYSKKYRSKNAEIIKEKKKLYRKEKPEIERSRHLKKQFGISIQEYNSLFTKQGCKCAICRATKVGNTQHKHMHVDHCHKTGKIRGILCSKCNTLLGMARDSIKILKAAIGYLA